MINTIVDSHCHLNFPQFKGKIDEIIKRAVEMKVTKMLTISTKLSEMNDLEEISKSYSQVFNTVGIHTHECKNHKNVHVDDLLKYTKNP